MTPQAQPNFITSDGNAHGSNILSPSLPTTIEPLHQPDTKAPDHISPASSSHSLAVLAPSYQSQNEQEHGHKSSLSIISENLEAAKSLQKCVEYKKTMRDVFKEKSRTERIQKIIVDTKNRIAYTRKDAEHKCLDVLFISENEFKKPNELIWYVRACFDTH